MVRAEDSAAPCVSQDSIKTFNGYCKLRSLRIMDCRNRKGENWPFAAKLKDTKCIPFSNTAAAATAFVLNAPCWIFEWNIWCTHSGGWLWFYCRTCVEHIHLPSRLGYTIQHHATIITTEGRCGSAIYFLLQELTLQTISFLPPRPQQTDHDILHLWLCFCLLTH